MSWSIRKIVVLGAGTMGAQLAAHLVARHLDVILLDMVPPGASDRSLLARQAIAGLRRIKPSPLHLPEDAGLIQAGNFEDDWGQLADADWIVEAIVEDPAIKRELLARVAGIASETAILTTNTSGLGIADLARDLPADLRRRFFGTHFFNPPRYLKLLEIVPTPDTDPTLLASFEAFCERVVGKSTVRCKDTPGFLANRIGTHGLGVVLRAMVDLDLSVDEVDALTGELIGRPKSATFRTCDLAGIDLVVKVAAHLFRSLPHDPERAAFEPPSFVRSLIEKNLLGEKTGGGFYRKEGGEIRTLDWKRLEYRERRQPQFAAVDAVRGVAEVEPRLARLVASQDVAGRFLWRVLSATSLYAASLVPEAYEDVVSIDRALEWGYGWSLGPFRVIDALGVSSVAERARAEGRAIPPLIEKMLAAGRSGFYQTEAGRTTVFGPTGVATVPVREGVLDLKGLRARGAVRNENASACLIDLGDGCGLVEFHGKLNLIDSETMVMLLAAVQDGRAHFDALVIGNQGQQFSAGANLALVLRATRAHRWDDLDASVRQFQHANLALKYATIPVVAAPFGLTLGGGCEISLHAARIQASAEAYMGLVEAGVGLIPAGGGTKELAIRAHDRVAGIEGADPAPLLRRAFDLIAFAKVSTSGAEALKMFGRDGDGLSPHPDRLLHDAQQVAVGLARSGWLPGRPRTDIPALGRSALAVFRMGIHNFLRAGHITEHDAAIATAVASVLCGGDRAPGVITERQMLDLEREAFLGLLGTAKTQERIEHMLKTGKPLRN